MNNIDIYLEYLTNENEFAVDQPDFYHNAMHHVVTAGQAAGHAIGQGAEHAGQATAKTLTDPNLPATVGNATYNATTGLPGKLAFGTAAGYAAYKLAKAAKERLRGR